MPLVVAQPLYRQIYDFMKTDIMKGTYSDGDQLPPQAQLAKEYGVSLMTLRQALDALERDGLIRRAHGRGTFAVRPAPLRARRVLLADDDEETRAALHRIIEREGYTVVEAHDGAEAVALAMQERYDRIFLDLRMPAVSGVDVVRTIKERDPRAAIVVVSGFVNDLTVVSAELWPLIVISKPFTATQIAAALHLGSRVGGAGEDGKDRRFEEEALA